MANKAVKEVPTGQSTFCRICSEPFDSGCTRSHQAGKKHQLLEKLRNIHLAKPTRWIYVTELPLDVSQSEVTEYLRQFCTVTSSYFPRNQQCCFVEFSEAVSKLPIFSHKHWLGDKEIVIKKIFSSMNKSKSPRKFFDGPDVLGNINHEATIENQVKDFLEKAALTDEEHYVRERLVAYIICTLQEVFPDSRVEVLGSTANGLAFLECDLDLSFFIPSDRGEKEIVELEKDKIPTPQDVLLGRFNCEKLSYLSKENVVDFVSKYLMYMPGFKTHEIVRELGFPVIQFIHEPANLRCTLSFNQSLGLANTQLLQLYSKLDYNVYALLMVLRFWGKREWLVGGSKMISSYAFNWLVLFYLQRKNFVPTVEKLAQLSDRSVESEGWDCSFTEDIQRIPVGVKDKAFAELMSGFFQFYSTLDFTSNIICPRNGSVRRKSEFLAEAGDKLNFQMTELSVQDVFDLSHNITASVSVETISTFHSMCAKQFIVWQDMIKKRKVCLNFLFGDTLHKETTSSVDRSPQKAMSSVDRLPQKASPSVDKSLYLDISLQTHNLSVAHCDIQQVCNFVLEIFKRVFLIQCDIVNASPEFEIDNKSCTITKMVENPSKKQKPNELLEKFLLEVNCQIWHRIWHRRKKMMKKANPTLPTGLQRLDYEEGISIQITKMNAAKVDGSVYTFNASFTLGQENNLKIMIIPKSTNNDLLYTVIPFVKRNITTLVETSLKAYLTSESS